MEKTKQSNDKLASWQPEMKPEHKFWIVDQLTILAESLGESAERVSPQRLKIYAQDLCDLDQGRLAVAFAKARRELKFFPKIAELRDLAGANDANMRKVEAEGGWQFALDYQHRYWYGDMGLLPTFSNGEQHYPPALPERIAYAVRRVGGLRAIAQITEKSRPFVKREFVEAYNEQPLAESLMPQLLEKFRAEQKLLSQSEELRALGEGEVADEETDAGSIQ